MGFWKSAAGFLSKQTERALLLVSGMQLGDSRDDSDKITSALVKFNDNLRMSEHLSNQNDSKAIMYMLLALIIIFVIFVTVMCLKLFVENIKSKTNAPQNIALTTLREGSRTIGATQSAPV